MIWVAIVCAGLLTFLTRLSFIVLWGRWNPPDWLYRALKYVPPAVLTAIIFPEVLIRNGQFNPLNPRLLAGAVAALVAWRTKNVILTILVGMVLLLGVQFLLQ